MAENYNIQIGCLQHSQAFGHGTFPQTYLCHLNYRRSITIKLVMVWRNGVKNQLLTNCFVLTRCAYVTRPEKSSDPFVIAAYLTRKDYNIFTVDWEPLTRFPCYLSAISNTRLVGQCTAQLYSFIMYMGGQAKKTTCVGHSLGAHICGMVSNHLVVKQHRIVGNHLIFPFCCFLLICEPSRSRPCKATDRQVRVEILQTHKRRRSPSTNHTHKRRLPGRNKPSGARRFLR